MDDNSSMEPEPDDPITINLQDDDATILVTPLQMSFPIVFKVTLSQNYNNI